METGFNTGIFTGEITLTGFSFDADGDKRTGIDGNDVIHTEPSGKGPIDGLLPADDDDGITVSFEFAEDQTIVGSAPIRWNEGTVQWLDSSYVVNEYGVVRIIDPDMNLNPRTLDKVKVNVSSDSDKAGILVDAIETQEESGIFETAVSFVQDKTSTGDRLFAIPGDAIYAKYEDHTLPNPYSISDDLEIETFAEISSSVPPTQRLENSPIFLSDNLGKPLQSFSPDNPIQMVGTITNNHNFEQKFVYLFQVKNDISNYVESISWIQEKLPATQSLDVSQSWIPKKPGTYKIETFVWGSLDDPRIISTPMSVVIVIE